MYSTPQMIESKNKDDLPTVAALGLLGMCLVTVAHEAVGHGGTCLLFGGRIRLLTSSVFQCSVLSGWVDAGGPIVNLICGLLALIARKLTPPAFTRTRFFLMIVTALSWFWEGGYTIHAMHRQDGDLYDFAQHLLGHVTLAERWIFAALGLGLYLYTVRLTSRALLTFAPSAQARKLARASWIAAALGATLAGSLGPGYGDLRDAILEVGMASFPLLLIPRNGYEKASAPPDSTIARSPVLITVAIVVFGAFAASLGHGIRLLP